MNHSDFAVKRLTELNATLDKKLVEFRSRDEETSTASKVAHGAAVAGAGLGALYLRGRLAAGAGAPNVGLKETIKGGASALKGDALTALRAAKGAYQGATGAVASAGLKADRVVSNAVRSGAKSASSALKKVRAKVPGLR